MRDDLDLLFPRSSRYDRAWIEANSLGENALNFAESLADVMHLSAGMRVLDLACGHAISSIFLAKEFGVTVWAVDRAIDPTANLRRIQAMNCEDRVFPLRADARSLPLPHEYFDAVVILDAFVYFGTDDRFLPGFVRHVKTGGQIGVVDACFSREIDSASDLEPQLREAWLEGWNCVHTPQWWKRHWEKTGLVRVTCCERVPHSDALRNDFVRRFAGDPEEEGVLALMTAEAGTLTGTFRLVGERTSFRVELEDDGMPGEY